jgi:hypothetical protein
MRDNIQQDYPEYSLGGGMLYKILPAMKALVVHILSACTHIHIFSDQFLVLPL